MALRVGFPGSVWGERSMVGVAVPREALWDSSAVARSDDRDFPSARRDLLRKHWSALETGHEADHFLRPLTSNFHYRLFNLAQRLQPLVRFRPAWHQDARRAVGDRDPRNRGRRAVLGGAGRRVGDGVF